MTGLIKPFAMPPVNNKNVVFFRLLLYSRAMEQKPPEEYLEIAEKVRTGEYFREARSMYDLAVHDPMAERYLYIAITAIAGMILFVAVIAARGLYPLSSAVPFIVNSNNIVDDLPRISMLAYKGEDPSAAMLRFLVNNYVTFRESYDIESFDRNISGIRSQSTEGVFREFQQAIDPRSPDSPIALYQRHSRRSIRVVSSKRLPEQNAMEVTYEAIVEGPTGIKTTMWQATIDFEYNGVTLDEETDKVKPINFIVTQYRNKRMQEG